MGHVDIQTALQGEGWDADDHPVSGVPGAVSVVRCRFCHRPLTDRTSRLWGIGPDCRRGLRLAPAPAEYEVEQDALPGT